MQPTSSHCSRMCPVLFPDSGRATQVPVITEPLRPGEQGVDGDDFGAVRKQLYLDRTSRSRAAENQLPGSEGASELECRVRPVKLPQQGFVPNQVRRPMPIKQGSEREE